MNNKFFFLQKKYLNYGINMNSNFLNEIANFSRSNLKKTWTKVSYANGQQFMISDGLEKELAVDQDDQSNSSTIYWSNKCGFLVDLIPDLSIDEIIPRLFLSGDDVALNLDILKAKNITHILNLTSNIVNKYESIFKYKKIRIFDIPSEKILKYFKEVFEFIENGLENINQSVLVHCNAGVSRSSSFVIGYLMYKKIAMSYNQAFELVKSKRSKICPNQGFVNQLISFESEISE